MVDDSKSQTKITSDQATKIYHILRSVEMLQGFAKHPKANEDDDILREMVSLLINQVATELDMEHRVIVERQLQS